VLAAVMAAFAPGAYSADAVDRICTSRDLLTPGTLRIRYGQIFLPPELIIWPTGIDEIMRTFELARELGVSVIPFGAGSGVCGGTLAVQPSIALDMKRMRRIGPIDRDRLTVWTEAGVIGQELEERLNAEQLTLGHFPSSVYTSTVGGYLAARSAGTLSSLYRKAEDMVLAFRAVSPAGGLHEFRAPWGRAGLRSPFIGSEGTMGVITEAEFAVHPRPETRRFRGFLFPSVTDGLEAMRGVMWSGIRPAALRLYDPLDTVLVGSAGKGQGGLMGLIPAEALRTAFSNMGHRLYHEGERLLLRRPQLISLLNRVIPPKCLLVMTFEGPAPVTAAEEQHALSLCAGCGGEDAGPHPAQRWWDNRYHVSYNQSKIYAAGSFVDTMEVALTWEKVADLYNQVVAALSGRVLVMAHFSHAYPHGCSIYFTFVGAAPSVEGGERLHSWVWDRAMAAVLDSGATITHHHGVGLLKARWMWFEHGPGLRILRAAQRTFDPDGIMNPGKLRMEGRR